jgi:signal transduction histidine kinase
LKRTWASYGYLGVLAVLVVLLNVSYLRHDATDPDDLVTVLFIAGAASLLNVPHVRIEQGRLTLSGIALGMAALLLNPIDATVVGICSSFTLLRRGRFQIVGNAVLSAAIASTGSVVAANLGGGSTLATTSRLTVLATCIAVNLLLVPTVFWVRAKASIVGVIRFNFSPSFALAFAYFGLAALLISYLLDGTPLGYLLTTIVCVLALALTDTIAGRRVRRVLESELSDADRHLFHSRAVEGVVHNLRNHMATAVGYLKEIDPRRLDPIDRESIETATAAANDAVSVLKELSQGATPRVTYSIEPVDLNELVTRAIGMARPRARSKEIQLAVRESPEEVKVRADPLLMREVATNLINNATDAAPFGGRVELSTGRRAGGSLVYFSVADNGPGISDENRHHLFEPHFTTKEGGTGLGLFMSYGVVREHQGDILFSNNRPHGAVFTVVLPPFGA